MRPSGLRGITWYLRRNWGAPFIIAFILLLIGAGAELSTGGAALADDVSVYAFYSLMVGIVLQIASYLKFGGEEEAPRKDGSLASPSRSSMFSPRIRNVLVVFVLAVIIVSAGAVAFDYESTHGFNSLSVTVNYVNTLNESGGVIVVAFAVGASGGNLPYTFTAHWPDGQVQNSTTGAFSRTFTNGTLPSSTSIQVSSADGQKVVKSIMIPAPSATTGSSTTTQYRIAGPIDCDNLDDFHE